MYKFERYRQLGLADFNQPVGLKMNPENRWVRKAATIPWDAIEEKYAGLFPSKTGMPAKPLRMALGSLMIQINEMIIAYNTSDDPGPGGGGGNDSDQAPDEPENSETIILDATCAPQNISYPQDVNLLNETRENLEKMIDGICYDYHYYKPRMYRENARRDYLNLAKCKKRTAKKIRKAVKQQLQYVRRDFGYVEAFLSEGVELSPGQDCQHQPALHPPIVRGKAAASVEFGAKLDMSIAGPSPGRPKKNAVIDKETEYTDNADRVEVERSFSLAKRCYGLGRIMTKLNVTTRSSIALSILVMNVARIATRSLLQFLTALFARYDQQDFLLLIINIYNIIGEKDLPIVSA